MDQAIFETKFSYFHTHLTGCRLPRSASPCSGNLNFHIKRHLRAHLDLSLIYTGKYLAIDRGRYLEVGLDSKPLMGLETVGGQ